MFRRHKELHKSIGHMHRMRQKRGTKPVLKWILQEQGGRRWPRGTWRKTVTAERKAAHRITHEIERMTLDQIEWHQFVVSHLCTSGCDED
jgi:hypothetical protein